MCHASPCNGVNLSVPIYERYYKKGRMLPDGLNHIDSWLTKDGTLCFQLMETERYELFEQWTRKWADLTHFEIIDIGEKPEKGSDG